MGLNLQSTFGKNLDLQLTLKLKMTVCKSGYKVQQI